MQTINLKQYYPFCKEDIFVEVSAKNIQSVKTAYVNTINVYDILKYNTVVATKAAVANIEEVYA